MRAADTPAAVRAPVRVVSERPYALIRRPPAIRWPKSATTCQIALNWDLSFGRMALELRGSRAARIPAAVLLPLNYALATVRGRRRKDHRPCTARRERSYRPPGPSDADGRRHSLARR